SVYYYLHRRGLLNWQIRRLFAFEDPAGIVADSPKALGKAGPVTDKTACGRKLTKLIDARDRVTNRKRGELHNMATEKWIRGYHESASSYCLQFLERGAKFIFGAGL